MENEDAAKRIIDLDPLKDGANKADVYSRERFDVAELDRPKYVRADGLTSIQYAGHGTHGARRGWATTTLSSRAARRGRDLGGTDRREQRRCRRVRGYPG